MNTQFIMDYLLALDMNNNREWYHANKAEYKKANMEFEGLLQDLIIEIGKFDSSILHNPVFDSLLSIKTAVDQYLWMLQRFCLLF